MKIQRQVAFVWLVVGLSIGANPSASAMRMTELVSPKLLQLHADQTGEITNATKDFWQAVESSGTPLIEPIRGEPDYVWLTFLFRGDQTTTTVILIGGISGEDPIDRALQQLGDSNVWYITYRMRNDLRARYGFAVNDDLTPINYDDKEEVKRRVARFRPDPLSLSKPVQNLSLLELDDAPPQPFVKSKSRVAKGKLINVKSFPSKILGNERPLTIYLPPDYDDSVDSYPMLLLFDRSAYRLSVPIPRILNHMIASRAIPPIVGVLVGNVPGRREAEMSCNDDFNRFLATELIPWARKEYNVSKDPNKNIVAGSSMGGLASSYFALKHSDLVGNVLSQSGSYMYTPNKKKVNERDPEFQAGWLIRQYAQAEREPVRFFIEVGLRETGIPRMPVIHRHFRDVLQAKGYEIARYSEFNGGHDYLNWRGSISDGLIQLLRN